MYLDRVTVYAIVAMIAVHEHTAPGTTPITIERISRLTGIPLEYLRKIVRHLVRADLFQSVRGRRGGVRLAREPHDINVRQVIEAVGDRLDSPCILDSWPGGKPPGVDLTAFAERCNDGRAMIQHYYEAATLADLLSPGPNGHHRREPIQPHPAPPASNPSRPAR